MCVAPKILNGIAKAIKSLFDVRTPVLLIKSVFPFLKGAGILQAAAGGRKGKEAVFIQPGKAGHVFSPEFIPEDSDRDKELTGGKAYPAVFCQSAGGNDAVHMHMIIQFLIPCMENLDDTGDGAEILFISGQFQEGFGTASVEQAVQKLLVTVDEGIKFVREGKHHMEIRCVNDLSPAFIHPDFFQDTLAFGAVPVTAGIVVELCVPAVGALADVAAELTGLAVFYGTGSFSLDIRQAGSSLFIQHVRVFKNLADMVISHGRQLRPAGQKG